MTELGHLLADAAAEIRTLRQRVDILQAKVDTMDFMSALLFGQPGGRAVCASPDIAWQIDKYLREHKEDSQT